MNQNNAIPRPEYPRPQLVRSAWQNLNGTWQFEMDHGKSGRARNLPSAEALGQSIVVPFCPESELSGIGHKDFMQCVWYRRTFSIPSDWSGQRVLVHFGAVDYATEVWVNGISVGTHRGGYASFSFEITKQLVAGENVIVVCAEDDVRSLKQPRGKQSALYHSHHCDYTRTTGIWQTVWLECVPQTYVSSVKMIPDPDNTCLHAEIQLSGEIALGAGLRLCAIYEGNEVGEAQVQVGVNSVRVTVPLREVHLWEQGSARLYDLIIEYLEDAGGSARVVDTVCSYFGLRTVRWNGKAIEINGKPVFQRLVLDQGFYPDGIYTAPNDDALRRDIELSMELGFNGARMHEKMFEPRYLYWADKLGYLIWGEHANWGLDISTAEGLENFLPEWIEGVERDFNHPALVGWCPFNETWDSLSHNNARQDDNVLRTVYQVTKAIDPTRPVIDTSGNFHVVTDIFDVHDYQQDVRIFAERYGARLDWQPYNTFPDRQKYEGQPYFVSEFGGIWWNPAQRGEEGWGYGARPTSEEEFLNRYRDMVTTLLDNPEICAFCYTQLYDVEQEVNGLLTYQRQPKFDPAVIRNFNTQHAAIEAVGDGETATERGA